MSKQLTNKIDWYLAIFLIGIASVSYFILLWACFRGVELTDESFYLVGYQSGKGGILFASLFCELYDAIFGWLEISLAEVRILRIILTISSCLLLWWGVSEKLKVTSIFNPIKWLILATILSGSVVGFSWGPMAISYNSFVSVFLNGIVGLALIYSNTKSIRAKSAIEFSMGVLLSFIWMVKFSSAVLIIPLVGFYWLIDNEIRIPKIVSSLRFLFWVLLGSAMAFLMVFNGFDESVESIKTLHQTIAEKMDSSYSQSTLLENYVDDVIRLLVNNWLSLLVIFILGLAFLVKNNWRSYIFWLGFIVIGVFTFLHESWMGGNSRKYEIFTFYFLFLIGALFVGNLKKIKKDELFLAIFLAFVPLVGAIGSSNGLTVQVLFYMPFYLLAVIIFLQRVEYRWSRVFLTTLLLTIACLQGLTGSVLDSYRQCESLLTKDKPLESDGLFKYQLVGKDLTSLNDQLQSLKLHKANYVFTFRHQIGVTILLDKMPYTADWLHEDYPDEICRIISKRDPIDESDLLFAIPEGINNLEKVSKCLSSNGIRFPSAYEQIKEIEYYNCASRSIIKLVIFEFKTAN